MSTESTSSFDAFYGIEKKRRSSKVSFENLDFSPYSSEEKSSNELGPQRNQESKLARASSIKLLHVPQSKIGCAQESVFDENSALSSASERDSYHEVHDFVSSEKSESLTVIGELNMSHNDRDSDENLESYETVPVKPLRKRVLTEPAKKKTTDTPKRKVRTVQPKGKLNKSKQDAKSRYVIAEQNADYVTQKLLTARKDKINELRNEIVDIQRQHKNLDEENKILRRINARQQRELSKIEESRDELPELVKAHNEEIRVLKTLLRQSHDKQRELEQRMKAKDSELHKRKEELQRVRQLSKTGDLLEKNVLHEKVESLQKLLQERDVTIMELNRKLELLEKNYRRDITSEKARQKELLNDIKSLQKEHEKLQQYLSLQEKKIGKQNIYTNTRKASANNPQSACPEPRKIPAEVVTPKQALRESPMSQVKEKSTVHDVLMEETCDKFANWSDKTRPSLSNKRFSTPRRDSKGTLSAFEDMTSLLDETSPSNERSAILPDSVRNEFERPRFEKMLDPGTKERLLSRLKALDFNESPTAKEESGQPESTKRLSPPRFPSHSIENNDFNFNSYIPSFGDSSRHSSVSSIRNATQLSAPHKVYGTSFDISPPRKSPTLKGTDNAFKINTHTANNSSEVKMDMRNFEDRGSRSSPSGSTTQFGFSDECYPSLNADVQPSERMRRFSSNISHMRNPNRQS